MQLEDYQRALVVPAIAAGFALDLGLALSTGGRTRATQSVS
ncbi:hypothetical protein QMK32_24225 [Rhodococcus sp. H29-C3]|nr:hypothetical protein [Rhodococcus sp. H29-C3]